MVAWVHLSGVSVGVGKSGDGSQGRDCGCFCAG